MIPAEFAYHAPQSLKEAVSILSATADAKVLGGGMSLIPAMKHRLSTPLALVDLQRIPKFDGIRRDRDTVVIGGRATHDAIAQAFATTPPIILRETAQSIGDVQVRNRGTIGGSLVHADPAADWPATFLALDGQAKVTGAGGARTIKAADFFVGMLTTAVNSNDILTEVRLPFLSQRAGTAYVKVRQPASGFAVVGVAVQIAIDKKKHCERIAVGVTGVNPVPFRASSLEKALTGTAITESELRTACSAIPECDPTGDIYASGEYRRHLLSVYSRRAILLAYERASG